MSKSANSLLNGRVFVPLWRESKRNSKWFGLKWLARDRLSDKRDLFSQLAHEEDNPAQQLKRKPSVNGCGNIGLRRGQRLQKWQIKRPPRKAALFLCNVIPHKVAATACRKRRYQYSFVPLRPCPLWYESLSCHPWR